MTSVSSTTAPALAPPPTTASTEPADTAVASAGSTIRSDSESTTTTSSRAVALPAVRGGIVELETTFDIRDSVEDWKAFASHVSLEAMGIKSLRQAHLDMSRDYLEAALTRMYGVPAISGQENGDCLVSVVNHLGDVRGNYQVDYLPCRHPAG